MNAQKAISWAFLLPCAGFHWIQLSLLMLLQSASGWAKGWLNAELGWSHSQIWCWLGRLNLTSLIIQQAGACCHGSWARFYESHRSIQSLWRLRLHGGALSLFNWACQKKLPFNSGSRGREIDFVSSARESTEAWYMEWWSTLIFFFFCHLP